MTDVVAMVCDMIVEESDPRVEAFLDAFISDWTPDPELVMPRGVSLIDYLNAKDLVRMVEARQV